LDLSGYFGWQSIASEDLIQGFTFLALVLFFLFCGKKILDAFSPFCIDTELTKKDNKAVAVSVAGYLFALGFILFSIISGGSQGSSLLNDIMMTSIWCLIGIFALIAAQKINDRFIFKGFSNRKELVEDQNIGLGAAEAGSYIGTGLILSACLAGDGGSFLQGLISAFLFFVLGQIAFIVFAEAYDKCTHFDFQKSIEADNAAVGVSFGLIMVAFANMLSGAILASESILFFVVWCIFGGILLFGCRFLVDKFILPSSALDKEIHEDKNWGASMITGSVFIIVSLLVNTAFL
jgi:uncharacterized membrane protein YjfL (UPF0719 family)